MPDGAIIAVGVDGTPSSRRALAWAAREALRRGGRLHVVTAWAPDALESAPLSATDPDALAALAERTQAHAVAEVVDPMPCKPLMTRAIVQGTAAEALVSASQQADLVVVGTHGRGPVRSFLLGSVSLSVIKHAACPVVVMPPVSAGTPAAPLP